MPIIKSAKKRAKQAVVRNQRNTALKRDIKDAVKDFRSKPTAKSLSTAQSKFDTAVKKGLLKKNTAARRKSKLAETAKQAGVKLSVAKKASETKSTTAKKTTSPKAAAKPAAAKKPAAKKPATTAAKSSKAAPKKTASKKSDS